MLWQLFVASCTPVICSDFTTEICSEEKRKTEAVRMQASICLKILSLSAQRALDEAETRAAESKAQVTRLTDQLESVQRKRQEELQELREENRKVQEELHLNKENGRKLAQAEAALARYKQKLGAFCFVSCR